MPALPGNPPSPMGYPPMRYIPVSGFPLHGQAFPCKCRFSSIPLSRKAAPHKRAWHPLPESLPAQKNTAKADILKQAVHYFLTEEDGNKTMLIPKFSWWYYKSIADEVNGRTLQYPLYEDGNTFKYDFAAMKDMIQKENPKILLLASPNNPTGNGLTPEELDELLAEVPAKTKVLIDEAYASFVSTDTRYIKELVNKYPNLIISRTLSKFYGLPGLRMGFGFMSKELEKFSKYSNKYLGYNRISEDIAIAALKSDAHYRNIAKLMNEDRARYEKEIGVLPGFKVYESVANFILIKYPITLKEALQKAFAEQSYKVKFMNEPDINTHLRITLGRPEQNRIVIDTIKEIASK